MTRKFYEYEQHVSKTERKQKGVYYTPLPIVSFINRSVDELLKDMFNLEDGLASTDIKVLDFAAGTGIFICDAIERAFKANKPLDEIYHIVQQNYYAFEIDPKAHQLCIENISEIFNHYGFSFNPQNISCVNTLSKEANVLF